MNRFLFLFFPLVLCTAMTCLSAQDLKPAAINTARTNQLQTVRVAKAADKKIDLRSAEAKNNWGAPAGILSSTKKTNGGRLTTTNYAKAGRAAGQTATETLRELRRGFTSISMGDLLRAIMRADYSWPEAAQALRDHDQQPGPATALLRAAGAPANDMATILKKQYDFNSGSVATVLKAGGYGTADIVTASRKALRTPADILFKDMQSIQADMAIVVPLIKKAYGFSDINTVRLARRAGVIPAELENVILTIIRPTSTDVTDLLKAAEVTPERIVKVLQSQYRMGIKQTAGIMKNKLGLPVDEAARLLRTVYRTSPEDIAEALIDGARYNYEQTKATLSKLYNMSLAEVVKLLSPWH